MNKFGKPSERGFVKAAQVIKGMVEAAPRVLLSRLEGTCSYPLLMSEDTDMYDYASSR